MSGDIFRTSYWQSNCERMSGKFSQLRRIVWMTRLKGLNVIAWLNLSLTTQSCWLARYTANSSIIAYTTERCEKAFQEKHFLRRRRTVNFFISAADVHFIGEVKLFLSISSNHDFSLYLSCSPLNACAYWMLTRLKLFSRIEVLLATEPRNRWQCNLRSLDSTTDSKLPEHGQIWWQNRHGTRTKPFGASSISQTFTAGPPAATTL